MTGTVTRFMAPHVNKDGLQIQNHCLLPAAWVIGERLAGILS
ncbi:MAG TPA: hypothetical protein VM223_16155 [Planctomycetota bacterium]|nr:hypothetical protein [Planctomycetota bacterium]